MPSYVNGKMHILFGLGPLLLVMHILSRRKFTLRKGWDGRWNWIYSLTYSANGFSNMHALPVIAIGFENRLAPTGMVCMIRSFAPLEVFEALGSAIWATTFQGRESMATTSYIEASRFWVGLRPAPCLSCIHCLWGSYYMMVSVEEAHMVYLSNP